MAIVTRESLQALLDNPNSDYVAQVVGRALVVIFNNQTDSEKTDNQTHELNGIGFSGADARSGVITAKTFIKSRTLRDWQVEKWTRRGKNGFSRLTKYVRQLNAAAELKVQKA